MTELKEPPVIELQPILEGHAPSRGGRVSNALHNWYHSAVVRVAARNLALIALWYVLGTSLTVWNRWLVSKTKNGFFNMGPFPAPFFVSALQFFAQHLIARTVIAAGLSQRSRGGDWRHYFKTVVPNGIATGLDIGFSNYSLVFITISFYVMCKSTTPLFLLVFAIAWGVERPSWSLGGVMVVIVCGLLLLVAGETQFDLVGFLLVMTAAMLAGLRWTITQVLLHGHKAHGAGSPTEVIFQLTPIMGVTLLLLSLFHERLWSTLPASPYFASFWSVCLTALIVASGGLLAFTMVWSEFALIKCTSALTFMVAGTFKEIITVVAGVVLDGDSFTWVNAMGLGVLILGVVLFNLQKYRKLKQGEIRPVHLEDLELPAGRHKLTSAASEAGPLGAAPEEYWDGGEAAVAMCPSPRQRSGGREEGGGGGEGLLLGAQGALTVPQERRVFALHDGEAGEEEEDGEGLALLHHPASSSGNGARLAVGHPAGSHGHGSVLRWGSPQRQRPGSGGGAYPVGELGSPGRSASLQRRESV